MPMIIATCGRPMSNTFDILMTDGLAADGYPPAVSSAVTSFRNPARLAAASAPALVASNAGTVLFATFTLATEPAGAASVLYGTDMPASTWRAMSQDELNTAVPTG